MHHFFSAVPQFGRGLNLRLPPLPPPQKKRIIWKKIETARLSGRWKIHHGAEVHNNENLTAEKNNVLLFFFSPTILG